MRNSYFLFVTNNQVFFPRRSKRAYIVCSVFLVLCLLTNIHRIVRRRHPIMTCLLVGSVGIQFCLPLNKTLGVFQKTKILRCQLLKGGGLLTIEYAKVYKISFSESLSRRIIALTVSFVHLIRFFLNERQLFYQCPASLHLVKNVIFHQTLY